MREYALLSAVTSYRDREHEWLRSSSCALLPHLSTLVPVWSLQEARGKHW